MVGSIPGLIAHVAFWGLLLYGWVIGEVNLKRVAIFVGFWLTVRFSLPYMSYAPARDMFSAFVATLDIALVFMIFKGDVRFT
jgi:hypothetical protein